MKVRFAAGLSRSHGHLMTLEIKKDGWPRTDQEAVNYLNSHAWMPVIVELELADPPEPEPVRLVSVQVVKISEEAQL